MKSLIESVARFWVGRYLPSEHIWVDKNQRPKGFYKNLRMYFRKWIIHPMRRRQTHYYSRELQKNGCRIVGVAGSSGKTTTKQMIHAILSCKYKTICSRANIDPVYNIPETVLNAPKDTQRLVLEMSVEFPGELDFYNWLSGPDIGVLVSVDLEHTQFFGDMVGVLKEEEKIATLLSKNSFAVLNYDDEKVRSVAFRTRAKVFFFGSKEECDLSFANVRLTDDLKTEFILRYKNKETKVSLPLLGYHFASLATAAACVGIINDVSLSEIKKALESVENEPHRMCPISLKDNITIIDDTYNANPLATKAALQVLKDVAGRRRKIFVFGEMKELGDYALSGHKEIGEFVCQVGVSELITVGDLTKETIKSALKNNKRVNVVNLDNNQEVFQEVVKKLKPNDVVLLKGSRSMKLDEVVDMLKSHFISV